MSNHYKRYFFHFSERRLWGSAQDLILHSERFSLPQTRQMLVGDQTHCVPSVLIMPLGSLEADELRH